MGSKGWEATSHEAVGHPATISGDGAIGDCEGMSRKEAIGKVAAVDTAVKAIRLTRGGRLALDGAPCGWQGDPAMEKVFIGQVPEDGIEISSAGHRVFPRVVKLNCLVWEGDHNADPVTAVHIDGDEELVKVKECLVPGGHFAGPSGHVGVVVDSTVGGTAVSLLEE